MHQGLVVQVEQLAAIQKVLNINKSQNFFNFGSFYFSLFLLFFFLTQSSGEVTLTIFLKKNYLSNDMSKIKRQFFHNGLYIGILFFNRKVEDSLPGPL